MKVGLHESEMARLRQRMLAIAEHYLDEGDDAEDAVHDALLRVMQRMGRDSEEFDPPEFCAMAMAAVRNRSIDMLRCRTATLGIGAVMCQLDSNPTPDQRLIARERLDRVERIIGSMPAMQQLVMRMCHFDGLSNREIAQMTALSEDAVRQHLSRGRRKLLELFAISERN